MKIMMIKAPSCRRLRHGALIAAVLLSVSACGGGGGGDSGVSTVGDAASTTAFPASAGASWPAMFAFMRMLATDETSEPLTTEAITNPPREDFVEPDAVS